MAARTYTAHAIRAGRWWEISIDGILGDRVCGQAKRLDAVEWEARTIVAMALDVPLSQVAVTIVVDDMGSAHDVQQRAEHIRDLRGRIDALASEIAEASRSLVRDLRRESLPEAEVATILDVSRQRIAQLSR